jgi:hypothetical protein
MTLDVMEVLCSLLMVLQSLAYSQKWTIDIDYISSVLAIPIHARVSLGTCADTRKNLLGELEAVNIPAAC